MSATDTNAGTAPATGKNGKATNGDKPKRQAPGPRPCYILLSDQMPEDMNVVGATRKAEEALEAIDKGEAEAYIRVMVK